MANYTMELRQVCNIFSRDNVEGWFKDYELTDYLTQKQIETITSAGVWSKDKLAKKIVDHYYMREIGFETPALFEHFAKITMAEIMEKKLPLIYSNSIEYNPLENVNITESISRDANTTGTNNSTGNNTSSGNNTINNTSNTSTSGLTISSDTPQGQINKTDILAGKYATATAGEERTGTETDSSSTTASTTTNVTANSTTSGNAQENIIRKKSGNEGIYITNQRMISEYRDLIISVDFDIIKELNKIFFGLY